MYIMTANGWRQLSPANYTPTPEPTPAGGVPAPYTGKFPSAAICGYFNELKSKLKYFDDGIRMVYGRADKTVETDNYQPEHPIKYPPKGFEVQS